MSIASPELQCPKCGGLIPPEAPQGLCPKCLLAEVSIPTEAGETSKGVPPARAELAAAFSHLEILELVGQGGMGFVFKARQPKLDRFVALKILPQSLAADPAFADRFTREARALAALNHPNIVTIHDFGQANGFYFLLMEFVDGVNLRQAMKAGRFTPEQALAIVPAICEALQYAHDQGIVHRDIKPENLLLNKGGRVKIADFGIAKILDAASSDIGLAESQPAGTPQYMAPEQKERRPADHRADIYSLGLVLYELLTGELPAEKLMPPSSRLRGIQIDVRLDEIVLRALEVKPELRYQTAAELRTQLETITGTPVPAASRPARSSRWITWSLRQAPLVREICAHLTPDEEIEVTKRAFLFGIWNAATFFAPYFCVFFLPRPLGWIFGFTALVVGLAFLPMWQRMQREFLASTAWARQHGLQPDQLKRSGQPSRHDPTGGTRASWRAGSQASGSGFVSPWPARIFWMIVAVLGIPVLLVGLYLLQVAPVARPTSSSKPVGSLKLNFSAIHKNVAIAATESVAGYPLHLVTVRFSGPELSHDQITASGISPPLLVPSSDQELNKEVPAPLRSAVPITNMASAFTFECPRSCQLQFALPSEEMARSAAEQMKKTLAQTVRLVPGEVVQLFQVGEWKGWLETHPFEPVANRFTFFRHEGRLLAQSPGSNWVESAVATIPPNSQLVITGHYTINNRSAEEDQFSATLASARDRPGIYWFTWFALPNPQPVDDVSKDRWELYIHDGATGQQLHRFQSSSSLTGGWKRRGWWDEPVSLLANKRLAVTMFERFGETAVANQSYSGFFLEMMMHRQTGAYASANSEFFRPAPEGSSVSSMNGMPSSDNSDAVFLLAVERLTTGGIRRWAPDGTDQSPALESALRQFHFPKEDKKFPQYVFTFLVKRPPDATVLDLWDGGFGSGSFRLPQHTVIETNPSLGGVLFRLATSFGGWGPETTTCNFGLPVRPARNLVTWNAKLLRPQAQEWTFKEPAPKLILGGEDLAKRHGKGWLSTVTLDLPDEMRGDWREYVTVTDHNGRDHRSDYSLFVNAEKNVSVWLFAVPLTNIISVRLQGYPNSDFQWWEFKDVRLKPGLSPIN